MAAIHALLGDDQVDLLAATGRRRNSARRGLAKNDLTLPAVLLNGAIGYDFAADVIFHQVTFDQVSLRHVLATLGEHDLGPVAYLSDTRAVAVEGVTTSEAHLQSLGQDLVWMSVSELVERDDVLGMSMLGIERALVTPALGDLDRLPGVESAAYADHLYLPFSVMLAPASINKEVGIRAYLDHIDLQPDRIIALGDGGNDLEMLAMADVALVVEGGDERALALADYVIDPPQHGGWARVCDFV